MSDLAGTAREAIGKWAQIIVGALLGSIIPITLYVISSSTTDGQYKERIDQQGLSLSASISQLAASTGDRFASLSIRANELQKGVTEATVLSARQDEKLANLDRKMDERGKIRDQQVEELNRKLETLSADIYRQLNEVRSVVQNTQVGIARIEALLTGRNPDGPPSMRGRN